MKGQHLRLVVTPEAGAPLEAPEIPAPAVAPPLVHLRITGRHGVFLLESEGPDWEQVVVDTRAPGGVACTCRPHRGAECSHVAVLRACGFLDRAA